MRKILTLAFLITCFPILAVNFIISGGASVGRQIDLEATVGGVVVATQKGGADSSYDIGFEVFFPVSDMFELGGGIRFEPEITVDGDGGLGDVIPVYLIAKVLFPMGDTALTAQINGGYDFVIPNTEAETIGFTNVTGGLYAGIGVGYEIGGFVIGANYNMSTLEASLMGIADVTATASKVNLTIGYKY